METELEAVNGQKVRAIDVFAHALRFFREHALKVHLRSLHSPLQYTFSYSRIGRECAFGVPLFSTFK